MDIPVQRAVLALPDPELLVVVILAAVGELLGLDKDIVEEVGADCGESCVVSWYCPDCRVKRGEIRLRTVYALWGTSAYTTHDDLAFERAEHDETKLGWE